MKMAVKFVITVGILILGFSAIILGQTKARAYRSAPSDPPASVIADPPTVKSPATENYVIGDDDMLAINVWKEPELTASTPVRSDGKISLPLIGEIQASGKTPVQLKEEIAARLRTYLAAPEVTVIVLQINSKKFNLLGRVMKPGAYPLSSTTTVLDAIAMGGQFQDFAKQKNIYILRKNPDGSIARIAFNYKDVIRGKHPETNIQLKPNDTIVVP